MPDLDVEVATHHTADPVPALLRNKVDIALLTTTEVPKAKGLAEAASVTPVLTASCGDGVVAAGETCDDGNRIDDDECSNSCTKCGDGIKEGPELCDDGNDAPGDGCLRCQTTDLAVWRKEVLGNGARLHPSGFLYTLAGAAGDVQQIDQDGKIVASWPGPVAGITGVTAGAWTGNFPLNDGGVLANAAMGHDAVDVHLGRYSSSGALQWAVWLQHGASTNGRYVNAASALGHTIAIAGLGAGPVNSSALITLLSPDGVEGRSINYNFQNRQTLASDVLLISDDTVCAGGAQWVGKDTESSGWVACWGAALLWERSFDKPILALRRLNETSLDALSTGAWTTVQLTDGTPSDRREGDFSGRYYGPIVGGILLASDEKSARMLDSSGKVLWSSPDAQGLVPAGINETGSAFFTTPIGGSTLSRYETNVAVTPDAAPTPVLVASTIDTSQASTGCQDYCAALVDAGCTYDQGYSSKPECITLCVRNSKCAAEQSAFGACLKTQGAVTCKDGKDPQTSGCDTEDAAYKGCLTKLP